MLLLVVPAGLWLAGTGPGPEVGGTASGAGRAAAPLASPAPVSDPQVSRAATSAVAEPVRVRLPRLGVDAPVVPVGVDERGEMAVPADVRTVGWYRFGAGPGGRVGSSVLAGHVDDRVQGLGAFHRLAELAMGDEVQVRLADGTELRYGVREVLRVDKNRLPVDQLFARDGGPRLTLVTCGGEFDWASRRFRDNVVVVAAPVA